MYRRNHIEKQRLQITNQIPLRDRSDIQKLRLYDQGRKRFDLPRSLRIHLLSYRKIWIQQRPEMLY